MKKLLFLMTALMLVAALCVPVLADEARLDYISDAAMLLTDEERETLEEQAQLISAQYQCGVYIITLEDFTDYVYADDIYEGAKAIYREYVLGVGNEQSGILLLLSMAERDYALIANGYGNTAFTDYGKDQLTEEFLDNFGDNDWYGGFEDFLEKSAEMLKAAQMGQPLDAGQNPRIRLVGVLISIGLGCLLAAVICYFLYQSMKSVSEGTQADAYLQVGSIDFAVREDQFTHTTETRVSVESKERSSGGTSVDSDGFSGKSGKF